MKGQWKTGARSYFGGGANRRYPTMKDDSLRDFAGKIKSIAAPNSVMFSWSVCPRLPFCIEFLELWGFRYATVAFTWIKIDKQGKPLGRPGYYTASNAELVLLGVRGSMKPAVCLTNSVVLARPGEHSRKPEQVRQRIELMYPDTRKIEIFARPLTPLFPGLPGWEYYGNEMPSTVSL